MLAGGLSRERWWRNTWYALKMKQFCLQDNPCNILLCTALASRCTASCACTSVHLMSGMPDPSQPIATLRNPSQPIRNPVLPSSVQTNPIGLVQCVPSIIPLHVYADGDLCWYPSAAAELLHHVATSLCKNRPVLASILQLDVIADDVGRDMVCDTACLQLLSQPITQLPR